MNHTKSNARSAERSCRRSIHPIQSSSKAQDSTQLIQNSATRATQGNTNIGSDQHFYNNNVKSYLTKPVHSGLERPKRSARTAWRLVRGVALVIGITLFLPVEQVSNAQVMPIKGFKQYAQEQTANDKQWTCLSKLWGKESAWNPHANNPHSTAFGIPQILGLKTHDPIKQIDLGIKYIKHRYDHPCKAWAFHKKHGWY